MLRQGALRIATADRIEVREGLLRGIPLAAAMPFAAAVSGSLVLLWFGVGGGVSPLERIRKALAARRPDTAEPLPILRLPLADAISHLLRRVQDAIAREPRFTDDAAHELRAPLTAAFESDGAGGLVAAEPLGGCGYAGPGSVGVGPDARSISADHHGAI